MFGVQLDLMHLGTIFVLDRDHDGRVSLDDLMQFATFCASKGKDCQPHEFQLQVEVILPHDLIGTEPLLKTDARTLYTINVRYTVGSRNRCIRRLVCTAFR